MFEGAITCADSIARFTAALTPGILFNERSIVPTHEEQVMPVILKLTCLVFILPDSMLVPI
jgi:hypothetical protein